MDEKLPTEYDAIILGTGMTECILAASLSRIGNKVLHLDRNDYYSGDWAGFNLQALHKWIDHHTDSQDSDLIQKETMKEDSEELITLPLNSNTVRNVKHAVYISDEIPIALSPDVESTPLAEIAENCRNEEAENQSADSTEEDESESKERSSEEEPVATVIKRNWCVQDLKREWRKFNLDLMPKVLYCRGAMVELLISSDIAKYCEFRSITRVLTLLKGQLQKVPCSRADVFASKQVSMIEKRMLMKLLTFCLDYESQPQEYAGFEDKSFAEFLQSKKLSASVRHFVQHAIARAEDSTSCLEGLVVTQKFLSSLGRYGNTAFLWPMYGAGELPQAFCRVCAVFGGTYCLKRTAVAMVTQDQKVKGIIDTEGQRLNAKWLIMESSYRPEPERIYEKWISRAILLTDQSLVPDNSEHISLLNLPKEDGFAEAVSVFELSSLSVASPQDLYVVHLSSKMTKDAETDLMPVIEKLFAPLKTGGSFCNSKPRVLMSLFFNLADTNSCKSCSKNLDGVYTVGGPTEDLDFDCAINEARKIFEELCPGEEFLPKAPNPEDIILEGEENEGQKKSGFEKDEEQKEEERKEEKRAEKEEDLEEE